MSRHVIRAIWVDQMLQVVARVIQIDTGDGLVYEGLLMTTNPMIATEPSPHFSSAVYEVDRLLAEEGGMEPTTMINDAEVHIVRRT